jgi:DEAD/DEAH box helicase domain-containing protein
VLGTIEPPWLQRECYPGAVYLHNGRGYRVVSLEQASHVVRLEPTSLDMRTDPLVEVAVAPRGEALASRAVGPAEGQVMVSLGPLSVRESVVGYRELRRGQSFSFALDQPLESVLETVGVWLDVPTDLDPDASAVHAFEHALVNALPLVLLCDRRDVGSSSEGQRVHIFDFAEGGIGLADKAFHLLETLLERAASLVRDCPCAEGCPNCLHLAGCADANRQLDKLAGLALLEGRSVSAARAAERLLHPAPSRPRPAATRADRRRRLRDIAEADLRARYDAPPVWLERGGLANLSGVGLVVVWSLGDLHAEVQPLTGGIVRTVPLSELSPPRADTAS